MRHHAWIGLWCLGVLVAGKVCADDVPDLAQLHSTSSVSLDQVRRVGAVERAADGVVQQGYAFQPAARPQIVITSPGKEWHWSGRGELHLRVQNAMPWAVTLEVEIEGSGQRLQASVGVPAGPPQTLVIPLHPTSPRKQGMQVGPPMPFDDHGRQILLATTVRGALDLY